MIRQHPRRNRARHSYNRRMNETDIDIDALREWIGRSETVVDHVTVPALARLSALLDRNDPAPRAGDPLPVGWYSVLFPRVVRRSQIGPDGHPLRGDFLPPVGLPRRMFAGRRSWFHAPLRIGDEAAKIATIHSISTKAGRSGPMVFVTVRAEIHSPRGLAIVEEQDIVYRGLDHVPAAAGESGKANAPAPRAAVHQAAMEPATWSAPFSADELTLFRYSALTFNGHRIHYDYPYVTQTEGYPGLLVNGGLATLMLYELARVHHPAPIAYLASRNLQPMFAHQVLLLQGALAADRAGAQLWIQNGQGALTLSAQARFEDTPGMPRRE